MGGWQKVIDSSEISVRILCRSWKEMVQGESLIGIFTAGFGVWGIGAYEGTLLSQKISPNSFNNIRIPSDSTGFHKVKTRSNLLNKLGFNFGSRFWFVFRYGVSNIVPSVIWGTKPADAIAKVVGTFPGIVLPEGSLNARNLLRVHSLRALRGALAGSVVLAQVVRLVAGVRRASERHRERVFSGKEPPLRWWWGFSQSEKKKAVSIRLAGRESDVTSLSLHKAANGEGDPVFPVFEDPFAPGVIALVDEYSGKNWRGMMPLYWHVPDGRYGLRSSWVGLGAIPRGWWMWKALGSNEGERETCRVLILEADASVGEEALSLNSNSTQRNTDLDLQEVSQGFARLQEISRAPSVLRVLLADPSSPMPTAGGHKVSLGERVSELQHADVLINSKKPLIRAMLSWGLCTTTCIQKDRKVLELDTSSDRWFCSIKRELGKHGWTVIDRIPGKGSNHPLLVYQRTTSDTVNTVEKLISSGKVVPTQICALLDSHEGLTLLGEVEEKHGCQIASICSAKIYHNLFDRVRHLARQGLSSIEIQTLIDSETSEIENH